MTSMKDLFVVTHTESIRHLENKVGGWYDTDLTPMASGMRKPQPTVGGALRSATKITF